MFLKHHNKIEHSKNIVAIICGTRIRLSEHNRVYMFLFQNRLTEVASAEVQMSPCWGLGVLYSFADNTILVALRTKGHLHPPHIHNCQMLPSAMWSWDLWFRPSLRFVLQSSTGSMKHKSYMAGSKKRQKKKTLLEAVVKTKVFSTTWLKPLM